MKLFLMSFLFVSSFAFAAVKKVPEVVVIKDLANAGKPTYETSFKKMQKFFVVAGTAKIIFPDKQINIPVSVLRNEGLSAYELHNLLTTKKLRQFSCELEGKLNNTTYLCRRLMLSF